MNWKTIRKEKKGSLDAVFLGASNVIEFWQPLFGWADHGIAVWNLSISGLTSAAFKHMIIEARKTQPDALYIVNLSTFKHNALFLDNSHINKALNYMPLSLNKLRMTHYLVKQSEFRGLDALEYYLPIIRFHSRWDDLKSWVFGKPGLSSSHYKMSYQATNFATVVYDITDKFFIDNDVRKPIPEDVGRALEDLLDYFDSEHVNALFVKSPQAANKSQQARMNVLEDILAERGYPCLDLVEDFYEAGLDTRMDFYNSGHTNIHGSIKFCKAVSDYLVENYHFEDKRGKPGWESWDVALEEYYAYCERYTLPFEREHAPRFMGDIPALSKPKLNGQSIQVTWTGIEGVDGYAIYRKSDKYNPGKAWTCIAEVDAALNEYSDDDLRASTLYTYTVVPYREADGVREYGSFDVRGMEIATEGESK